MSGQRSEPVALYREPGIPGAKDHAVSDRAPSAYRLADSIDPVLVARRLAWMAGLAVAAWWVAANAHLVMGVMVGLASWLASLAGVSPVLVLLGECVAVNLLVFGAARRVLR